MRISDWSSDVCSSDLAGIKEGIETELPGLLADPEVRALVLTGSGRAFCAGGDIRAFDQRDTTAMRRRMQRSYRWLIPLLTADKPVVTAVNGVAAGAGFSLALAGAVVVASTEARFKRSEEHTSVLQSLMRKSY